MKTTALRLSKHPVFEVRKCSVPVIPSDHCSSPRTHSSVYFSGILSGHRASSEHTQITVPLPNTLISPCLSQHIQITVPLISILRSSLHVQFPDTLIKSLFTPEHSHTTVNFSKHCNKTEVPPTLTQNAASLPIRTYAHLCRRFSVRTLSNSPELSASRTPSERLLLHCGEECLFLEDTGNTDIAILHTVYSPLKTSKTLNISRINFTTCLIVQFMVPGSQPDLRFFSQYDNTLAHPLHTVQNTERSLHT